MAVLLSSGLLKDPVALPRVNDYSDPQNPADLLPIVYGDLTTGGRTDRGVYRCPKVNDAGDIYALAGHAIQSSGQAVSLYDLDGLISGSEYSVNVSNAFEGGIAIATATFTTPPNGEVTARLKGKVDSDDALITNPVSIAEDFLTNIAGFPTDLFDTPSLERARTFAATQAYVAAGVVSENRPVGEVVLDIISDFLGDWWISESGLQREKLFFFLYGQSLPTPPVAEHMAERHFSQVSVQGRLENVVNLAPAVYSWNQYHLEYEDFEDGTTTEDTLSQSVFGTRKPPDVGQLELNWIRSSAVVQAVQTIFINRFSEPNLLLSVEDRTFRTVPVQKGDHVGVSLSWLYTIDSSGNIASMRNQVFRVQSKVVDFRRRSIQYVLEDTGSFLDDGSGNRDTTEYV